MNIFKFINSHLSVSIADGNINHHLDAEIIEPGDVLIKDCALLKESRKLKGEKHMKENDNNLEARGVSLTKKQWDRCDRLAEEYGKRSRNAFIREAVDFYCAWLEKEHIQKFLLPSLESVMSAKIRDSEERLRRLLFKIAVDQDMLAVLFSREFDHYDDYTLEEMRRECVRTVSETNGTLRVSEHMK